MVQPNGSHTVHHQHATIRLQTPDPDNTPELRAMFAPPACLEVLERQIALHDIRTDPNIIHGPEGLDKQGFAYIKHTSPLVTEDDYFTGTKVEDVYIPEIKALAMKVLGAKRVAVYNVGVRRKPASKARADPKFYWKRGEMMDKEIAAKPKYTSVCTCALLIDWLLFVVADEPAVQGWAGRHSRNPSRPSASLISTIQSPASGNSCDTDQRVSSKQQRTAWRRKTVARTRHHATPPSQSGFVDPPPLERPLPI